MLAISNLQLLSRLGGMLCIDMLLLILFGSLSPYHIERNNGYLECVPSPKETGSGILYTLLAYKALMISAAIYLAWRVRHIPSA